MGHATRSGGNNREGDFPSGCDCAEHILATDGEIQTARLRRKLRHHPTRNNASL